MLNITRLKEFVVEVKTAISSINFAYIVVDDSQLITILKELKPADNNLFIAIMPQFDLSGSEDKTKWTNRLMFMVLAKNAKRDSKNNDQYIDMFGSTQATALEFVNYMLEQKVGEDNELCGLMNELIEDSIRVTPIWEKAQCDGWMIEIDLYTRS